MCCCWSWIPQRYVISFLCFLAMLMSYVLRFSISIAITEMAHSPHRNTTLADPHACPYDDDDFPSAENTTKTDHERGEFEWSEETQGIILSSFFWGYVLTQVPGGLVAERLGGKYPLALGTLMSSVCSLLTPPVTRSGGPWALVTLRIVMGLGQGLLYPSVNALLAKWAPLEERGRLGAFVFAGANFGNIVSMSLSGLLLSWTDGDWALLFYTYGAVGLLWVLLWVRCGYSSPQSHPGLSLSERRYLDQYSAQVQLKKTLPPTPWRAMFTSPPLLGLIVAQIGHDWGLFTIITDLPKYMKSVMHFSIAKTGLLSALPYVAMVTVGILAGMLVDFLLAKKITTITSSRKIFTTIASTGPALGIVGATYAGCNKTWVTAFFILGMGLMGFFYPSLKINCLDLSPNYAGTVMALVGGIGAVSGIITPYIAGLLIPDNTMQQWRHVFLLVGAILVLTNLVYISTASGEVQSWNDQPEATEPRPGSSRVVQVIDDLTVNDPHLGFRKTTKETYKDQH